MDIDDRIVYTLEDEQDQFTVEVINGEYVVKGPAVVRLMGRVNVGDNESFAYLQRMLKKMGIDKALREKGVCEGDTVILDDWMFEWYE